MKFNIYTLHPDIFTSFFANSLIARGIDQGIIEYNLINWREKYGIGGYKQIDDRPYGGGTGMVLMIEPIFKALLENKALGFLYESLVRTIEQVNENNQTYIHDIDQIYSILNAQIAKDENFLENNLEIPKEYNIELLNCKFEEYKVLNPNKKNITISLTPKGFLFNQEISQYLADNFDTLNILCGRYEGFDARVGNLVDLEISIGSFVTNGGEIPAMTIIESVSRLLPGFVTKSTSILHDSFSLNNNDYTEQKEFIIGKKNISKKKAVVDEGKPCKKLFNSENYQKDVLPYIEHPIFTKPRVFQGMKVPELILNGDHKNIDKWRKNWYK